ncbi:MAG TPA: hypothetical protein VI423_05735 [Paenisporosarcina sp.]|nr:hypothetical protein [Paenisporosarcina sp.]
MDFALITDHPDYEEIVSKLVTGVSIKDISQWLKVKYPDKSQKHLQLGVKVLQEFANKHVDLEAHLKQDIMAVKAGDQDLSHKLSKSLLNNKTYQDRLLELANAEVDLKRMVTELVLTCKARMEQVFDKIQENPTNTKGDYVLLKYFEVLFIAMEKFDKIVNNAPDQVIQHNVTMHAMEQHTTIFVEAIRETLAQIDSESALLFMEIFTEKLAKLKAPQNIIPTVESKIAEAKLLRETILTEEVK